MNINTLIKIPIFFMKETKRRWRTFFGKQTSAGRLEFSRSSKVVDEFSFSNLKCYYINLEHRQDRKQHIESQLKSIGLTNFERLPAIKFRPGYVGCTYSHLLAVSRAIEENLEYVLICEDDIEFLQDRIAIEKVILEFVLSKAMVLCLSYSTRDTTDFSDDLLRLFNTQTASCYLIKRDAYLQISNCYLKSIRLLLLGVRYQIAALDQVWKLLQYKVVFVGPKNRCAKQVDSYSDIEQRAVSYRV